MDINQLAVNYLVSTSVGIFPPRRVEFAVSEDARQFQTVRESSPRSPASRPAAGWLAQFGRRPESPRPIRPGACRKPWDAARLGRQTAQRRPGCSSMRSWCVIRCGGEIPCGELFDEEVAAQAHLDPKRLALLDRYPGGGPARSIALWVACSWPIRTCMGYQNWVDAPQRTTPVGTGARGRTRVDRAAMIKIKPAYR